MGRKSWLKFVSIFVAWTLFGIYSGTETHYRSSLGANPYTWTKSLLLESSFTWLWALITPVILWLARRYRIERHALLKNIAVHAAASAFFAIATKLAWDLLTAPFCPSCTWPLTWSGVVRSVAHVFTMSALLYWVVLLLAYAIEYYRGYQAKLVEAARLETDLAKAQLQALRMQLHPHFLFNTLHSISALVHENPEAAESMIARLSELLRHTLEKSGEQEVPLRQELKFIELYLAIEKIRFEERLIVMFDIDPATTDALVPNMILQPLVENSIRHGISHKTGTGIIQIISKLRNSRLTLLVVDNGRGLGEAAVPPLKQGVGLGATRSRLERLYGSGQIILLKNMPGGGVEAEVTIPFERAATREDNDLYASHSHADSR